MREIKFRAWDKKTKTMHHWDSSEVSIDFEGLIYYSGSFHPDYQDRFIIMQFTGLKDKNRKKIFEGDIIQDSSRGRAEVKWLDVGMFNVCPLTDIEKNQKHTIEGFKKIEVIGNKFENPELLEESE